jgi:hypothetical protein
MELTVCLVEVDIELDKNIWTLDNGVVVFLHVLERQFGFNQAEAGVLIDPIFPFHVP